MSSAIQPTDRLLRRLPLDIQIAEGLLDRIETRAGGSSGTGAGDAAHVLQSGGSTYRVWQGSISRRRFRFITEMAPPES